MKTLLIILLSATVSALAEPVKPLYENNFEKATVNQVPDDFLVIDGGFTVKEENGNKFLELPGSPLDTVGLLFGPTKNSGVSVSARIYGTGKGRRFPTLGIGLNGVGGYKLKISPGKKALELYKGDDVLTSVSYDWKSDSWTILRLQVRELPDHTWKIEGKAWAQSEAEPKEWMISGDEKNAPTDGRASVWGSPYSGTPIRFDDLLVTEVK